MPPPMAVRLAADLRPSADGSAPRTSPAAGQLQAAGAPTVQAGTDGQTDERIAVSLNAPIRRGHIKAQNSLINADVAQK